MKLIHSPQHRVLVGLGYADAFQAADHVMEILEFEPIGLEGMEGSIIEALKRKKAPHVDLLPPEGGGFLMVSEFGADEAERANDLARQLVERLKLVPDPPLFRESTARARRAPFGNCARPDLARLRLPPALLPSGRVGTMPQWRRRNWAGTYATFAN